MSIKINNIEILKLEDEFSDLKDDSAFIENNFIKYKHKFGLEDVSDDDISKILNKSFHLNKKGFREICIDNGSLDDEESISKTELEHLILDKIKLLDYEEKEVFDYFIKFQKYYYDECVYIKYFIDVILYNSLEYPGDIHLLVQNIKKKYNKYLSKYNLLLIIKDRAVELQSKIEQLKGRE